MRELQTRDRCGYNFFAIFKADGTPGFLCWCGNKRPSVGTRLV